MSFLLHSLALWSSTRLAWNVAKFWQAHPQQRCISTSAEWQMRDFRPTSGLFLGPRFSRCLRHSLGHRSTSVFSVAPRSCALCYQDITISFKSSLTVSVLFLSLWPNCRNFRVPKEIWVEKHDDDVIFQTGSGNTAVSCMRHASDHNYRNSSFIVDMTMWQIPRSTERHSI